MNKKLLIAAVGAALVAGPMLAANAAPTVYGKMNVGVAMVDNGNTTDGDTIAVTDDASRVGIKGDEDLGGGMKAIYMFETQIDADAGGFSTGRDVYAGLQGNWGSVRLGNYNSAYKNVWTGVELFADTVGDFTGSILTFVGGETRTPNTIGYTSPDMAGFSAQIESSRGESGLSTESNPMSLALKYSAGPLYVGFGIFDNDLATGVAGLDGANKLAASFKMDAFTLVAAMETQDNQGVATTYDTTHIGGMFSMGNNDFALTFTTYEAELNGGAGNNSDYDAEQWALGWFHKFSKNTVLKTVYSSIDNETAGTYAGRMVSSASVGLAAGPTAGNDPTALQVQISTSF